MYDNTQIIIFVGNSNLYKLKNLRKGFRHCFMILTNSQKKILHENLLDATVICILSDVDNEFLIKWCHSRGFSIIKSNIKSYTKQKLHLRLFSCVEGTRRILREERINILTPWQLYRLLREAGRKDRP
jgi:hypothetical protein